MSSVVLKSSNNLNSVNSSNSNLNHTSSKQRATGTGGGGSNSYYLHANATTTTTTSRKDTVKPNNTLSYRQANATRPVEMRISNNENRVPAAESSTLSSRRTNQYAARPARANMNISSNSNRRSTSNNENREQQQQQQQPQVSRAQAQSSPRAVENSSYSNFASQYVPTIDQIIPRLYISDDIAARNRRMLDEKGITHILNLTTNIPNKFEPEITYKKFIIFDMENQNIDQFFDEAFEFIDNALKSDRNAVLVHCNAGISRSSSFIIAYLMLKRIFPKYKDALNHVRERRPIVNPNKGFERQLLFLESRLKKNSVCSVM